MIVFLSAVVVAIIIFVEEAGAGTVDIALKFKVEVELLVDEAIR